MKKNKLFQYLINPARLVHQRNGINAEIARTGREYAGSSGGSLPLWILWIQVHRLMARMIIVMILLDLGSGIMAQTTITGGTTLTVLPGTTLSSGENFNLNSGATLNNQGNVVLKKNLTNSNAAANPIGSGTIQFTGTSNQAISGLNIIQHLTVNNAAGLAVSGNTRVNGTLTLTNGKVALGTNNLLLGPLATVTGSPGTSAMVVPTGTGQLQKEYAAAGSFTFPVGDATGAAEYSPVTLQFNSGTFAPGNTAGVTLIDAQYPGTATNYLSRYWTVSSTGITDFSSHATFRYTVSDVNGSEGDIYCFKVDPAQPWIAYNASNNGSHEITAHGLSSFGIFTGNAGNLQVPPSIRSLQDKTITIGTSGCADAQQTLLVAGNGTTYLVQNGGSMNHIAGSNIIYSPGFKVEAGGYLHGYISNVFCNPYNHNQPVIAGTEEPRPAPVPQNSLFTIYPNPTSGEFTLELKGEPLESAVQVEIFGIHGERLLSSDLQMARKQVFSLASKPTGVFIVHVRSGSVSETVRIIKK